MLSTTIKHLARREEGQTMAEYSVVLAVITVAIIFTLVTMSGAIDAALQSVTDTLAP